MNRSRFRRQRKDKEKKVSNRTLGMNVLPNVTRRDKVSRVLLRAATRDFNARARARRIVMPCAPHCSTLHDYVTTSMGSGGVLSYVERCGLALR